MSSASRVGPAYLGVVFIWSTTALAIQWSVVDLSPLTGLLSRLTLGSMLALLWLRLLREPFPVQARDWQAYGISGAAMAFSMFCTYWSATQIPSGLLAVLFGLSPLITALLARPILGERVGISGLAGMGLGLAGLWVIFGSPSALGAANQLALALTILGVLIQAMGAVALKKRNHHPHPGAVTAGTLLVAGAITLLAWLLIDQPPQHWPHWKSVAGVIYLAGMGSVLAMTLYFYLLKRLTTAHVALITLITPVSSLWLGHVVNGEPVDHHVWQGTGLIVLGLLLNQWRTIQRWMRPD